MGRNTRSGRAHALAAAGLCLAALACQQPAVGTRAEAAAPTEGPRIVIEHALPDLHGHVVATFSVSQDDVPLLRADVEALDPRFTLATLSAHPVDGLRAWKSQLLNGPQVAVALPPSGPGTPAALVLANVRQPGAETPASLVDLGDGRFRYVFTTALTAFDPDETIRVGAWLAAAPKPSARTSATYDFRPSGGLVEQRDTVVDESCARCHGAAIVHHRTRSGVGLCLTCHTWQNSDPNTFDPAALGTPTIFTDSNSKNNTAPNPLELGRLVHRLHLGKRLPTLYLSRSTAWEPDPLSTTGTLPVPTQSTSSSGFIEGRSFAVVGDGGILSQYGRFVRRARLDGTTVLAAEGVQFPTDLRDCGVCHEGAPQQYEVTYAISRRTCSGCHPDAWFGPAPISDVSHAQHPGGPQADDSGCAGCHIPGAGPKTWVPIGGPDSAHVAPWKGARYNRPRIEIVSIADFQPGLRPTITLQGRGPGREPRPDPRRPRPRLRAQHPRAGEPGAARLRLERHRVRGQRPQLRQRRVRAGLPPRRDHRQAGRRCRGQRRRRRRVPGDPGDHPRRRDRRLGRHGGGEPHPEHGDLVRGHDVRRGGAGHPEHHLPGHRAGGPDGEPGPPAAQRDLVGAAPHSGRLVGDDELRGGRRGHHGLRQLAEDLREPPGRQHEPRGDRHGLVGDDHQLGRLVGDDELRGGQAGHPDHHVPEPPRRRTWATTRWT